MKFVAYVLLGVCIALPIQAKSLFNESRFNAYAADKTAKNLGDLVTIIVVESAKAETRANTAAESDTGVAVQGGYDFISGSVVELDRNLNVDFGIGSSTSGGGGITRSGNVRAQITAKITAVDEYGNLEIEGEQDIIVNDERQKITLKGAVRPKDISQDNTVLSNRIANAKIEFVGDGVLAESQKPSVIYRFLTWLGL